MRPKVRKILPRNWADTLKLPKTDLPPRQAPANAQAVYLRQCTDYLYAWQKANRLKATLFTLSDGPPYANGDLHIGHALNKILKDVTCRVNFSLGKRIRYIPGFDCHGMPIEVAVIKERKAKAAKQAKLGLKTGSATDSEPANEPVSFEASAKLPRSMAIEIRQEAKQRALQAVDNQCAQFREWAIMADWSSKWTTMDKDYEIKQLDVFRRMVEKGLITREQRPIHWSTASQTALAEGELEYRNDHVSQACYIKYPIVRAKSAQFMDVSLLIWTTQPWTLPANAAIAINPGFVYRLVSLRRTGKVIVAESQLEKVIRDFKDRSHGNPQQVHPDELEGALYDDAFWTKKPEMKPVIMSKHVTNTAGTGLVHIAPAHGLEDFRCARQHDLRVFSPVDDDGRFTAAACPANPSLLAGKSALEEGNVTVMEIVSQKKGLLNHQLYKHKYPYDWRSKTPVLLRATRQWFLGGSDLRNGAVDALRHTDFLPPSARTKLSSFVKDRDTWCISRQRVWGVPIPVLFHRDTDAALLTSESINWIIGVIKDRGIDAWWSDELDDPMWTVPSHRDEHGMTPYRRGKDTLDVWFDSGTSWTQTSSDTEDVDAAHKDQHGRALADLYLEGSDQHRGWFQSSLLTFVAAQPQPRIVKETSVAPYRKLVTHGFVLDQQGRKMSKSEGNVISPREIMEGALLPIMRRKLNGEMRELSAGLGVDALRLWAASTDYTKDVSVGPELLLANNLQLSKYRTTFRHLLGLLDGWTPQSAAERSPAHMVPKNHLLIIRQLESLVDTVRHDYKNMEYHKALSDINRFFRTDLSACYFESVKDAAYCGTKNDLQIVQEVFAMVLFRLLQILSPIVPVLVQEVWTFAPQGLLSAYSESPFHASWESSHRNSLITGSASCIKDQDMQLLNTLTGEVRALQEAARTKKEMKSSLKSVVHLELPDNSDDPQLTVKLKSKIDEWQNALREMLVVSRLSVGTKPPKIPDRSFHQTKSLDLESQAVRVHVYASSEQKCIRCWRYIAPIDKPADEALCKRCDDIVENLRQERPELFNTPEPEDPPARPTRAARAARPARPTKAA